MHLTPLSKLIKTPKSKWQMHFYQLTNECKCHEVVFVFLL